VFVVGERLFGVNLPCLRHFLFARPARQQRLNHMGREKPHHGNHDAVADEMIGLVVLFRQPIGVRQPHQSSGFPRRKQARPNLIPLHDHDRLPA
jgi:hypothetical protein